MLGFLSTTPSATTAASPTEAWSSVVTTAGRAIAPSLSGSGDAFARLLDLRWGRRCGLALLRGDRPQAGVAILGVHGAHTVAEVEDHLADVVLLARGRPQGFRLVIGGDFNVDRRAAVRSPTAARKWAAWEAAFAALRCQHIVAPEVVGRPPVPGGALLARQGVTWVAFGDRGATAPHAALDYVVADEEGAVSGSKAFWDPRWADHAVVVASAGAGLWRRHRPPPQWRCTDPASAVRWLRARVDASEELSPSGADVLLGDLMREYRDARPARARRAARVPMQARASYRAAAVASTPAEAQRERLRAVSLIRSHREAWAREGCRLRERA